LMIGDSWEVDILGAMNSGIDQVHLNRKNQISFTNEDKHQIQKSNTNSIRIRFLKELYNYL